MIRPGALLRRAATAAILSAVAVSFVRAQTPSHPNFSGTWVMDLARSGQSSFTPKSTTYAVAHHGDTLVVDRETLGTNDQVTKAHMVYAIDGKAWKNMLPLVGQTLESSSVLSWEGDALVIRSTSRNGEDTLLQVDTWTLSADGKTLTMKREASYAGNPIGSPTWVFSKKE